MTPPSSTPCREGNEAGVLDTLAERCEQATGPSSDIDAAIVHTVIAPDPDAYDWDSHKWLPYTASLDAAMTLAPNLIGVELSLDQNDRWHCELSTSDLDGDGEARAATKELAFVAAALRARTQPPPLSDEGMQ